MVTYSLKLSTTLCCVYGGPEGHGPWESLGSHSNPLTPIQHFGYISFDLLCSILGTLTVQIGLLFSLALLDTCFWVKLRLQERAPCRSLRMRLDPIGWDAWSMDGLMKVGLGHELQRVLELFRRRGISPSQNATSMSQHAHGWLISLSGQGSQHVLVIQICRLLRLNSSQNHDDIAPCLLPCSSQDLMIEAIAICQQCTAFIAMHHHNQLWLSRQSGQLPKFSFQ